MALEICPAEHKQEISTFYANRAAAYEKLVSPLPNAVKILKIRAPEKFL